MGIFPDKVKSRREFKPGLLLLLVAVGLAAVLLGSRCPFREYVGISCPACGSTRAWVAVWHGEWLEAFAQNPLFWFWGCWVGVATVDLLQRAFSDTHPSVGQKAMLVVYRNRYLRLFQALAVSVVFIYVNARQYLSE